MSLILPRHVLEELENEKLSHAEALRVEEFSQRLKALDSRLELFLSNRNYPECDIRAGWYYVIRRNDDGTFAMWQIQNPDGSFREPDEGVIEAFRAYDTWANPHLYEEMRKKQERIRAERKRAAETRAEQAREHLADLAAYHFRTQVPVTPEGKGRLTNRIGGRERGKA